MIIGFLLREKSAARRVQAAPVNSLRRNERQFRLRQPVDRTPDPVDADLANDGLDHGIAECRDTTFITKMMVFTTVMLPVVTMDATSVPVGHRHRAGPEANRDDVRLVAVVAIESLPRPFLP